MEWTAWITVPAQRKRQALKSAWLTRWNSPEVYPSTSRPRESGRAEPQHHVADLAHGRIGEHLLELERHHPLRRGQQRGERAHPGDHVEEERRAVDPGDMDAEPEDRHEPRYQVDTALHHRRRMDQRGNRTRSRHRFRQPFVEGKLRRLAGRPGDEEQDHQRQHPRRLGHLREPDGRAGVQLEEVQRPAVRVEQQDPAQHQHVARAGRDERLERCGRWRDERRRRRPTDPVLSLIGVVVTDQPVAADPDQLPADEEPQQVVGQHQQQHAADEAVHPGPEAGGAGIAPHVAGAVDHDQEADHRDDVREDDAQRIDQQPESDPDRGFDPRHAALDRERLRLEQRRQEAQRRDGCNERGGEGDGQPGRRTESRRQRRQERPRERRGQRDPRGQGERVAGSVAHRPNAAGMAGSTNNETRVPLKRPSSRMPAASTSIGMSMDAGGSDAARGPSVDPASSAAAK